MLSSSSEIIETSSIYYSTASTFEKGYQAMAENMERLINESYTAIFATNDMLALARESLAEARLGGENRPERRISFNFPRAIAVIGLR